MGRASRQRKLRRQRIVPAKPPEQLWKARRAGARNIAGVRYQLRLTAVLLVRAAVGDFAATALTPEGLEDVDMEPTPGTGKRYVQAKEQASPGAFLGPGDLVDFLTHAAPMLRSDPDAVGCLVTNGTFGGGLVATGWEYCLKPMPELVANIAGVVSGMDASEVEALLRRIQLVEDAADLTAAGLVLAEARDVDPSVAQLALDGCLATVLDTSAEQAQRPLDRPVTLTLSALDEAVENAKRAIASASVPIERLRRVVAPLTFKVESALTPEEFLTGVDVRPEHIAAGLDVARREELDAIAEGLVDRRLALIVGPSGAGKSALLWRSAADHALRMRVWRVHVLTEGDTDVLIAAIEQQRPSESHPVLVCVDDIGRASRAGWRRAAEALLEMPGVYLAGAAREEDFAVADALRRAVIVRPILTRQTAKDIELLLRERGVSPVIAVDEALGRARGLLMEFLHLVVAGKRLSSVLAEQAADLEDPGRATELAVARYVTASHSVGLEVNPATLQTRMGGPELTAALSRLDREHVIVESAAGTWTGLHELRSVELCALLHRRPPPRVEETLAAVVTDTAAEAVTGRLPVIVRGAGDRSVIADAVAERVAAAGADSAQWLEAARLADVAAHARECVRVARTLPLPATLNLGQWVDLAAMTRFAGVDLSILPEQFHEMAARLPEPDPCVFRHAAGALDEDEWVRRALALPPAEGARLLEALETGVAWTAPAASRLAGALPTGDVRVDARWVASLHRACVDAAAETALLTELQTPDERLATLRDQWPLLTSATLEPATGIARTRVLHPIDGAQSTNDLTVALAAAILDLLPEAQVAEVTVTRYDDADLPILGQTGPHKAIPRGNLPSQVLTRWNRAFGDWVERELSSTSLTARLRAQADAVAQASDVVLAMIERVAPSEDGRAARRWDTRRLQLQRDVASLGAMPPTDIVALAPLGSAPRKRVDDASQALQEIGTAAQQFADALADADPAAGRPWMRIVGARLRDAAGLYRVAVAAGAARLAGEPDPLDSTLNAILDDAAAVLIGYADGAAIELPERLTTMALHDVAVAVRDGQLREEREVLRQALAGVPGVDADAARLVGPGEKPGMVADPRRWLLPVAPAAIGPAIDALLHVVRAATVAHPLAFRVVVAPAHAGALYSYTATVIGARDSFPVIDVGDLRELAREAALPVRPGRFVSETAEVIEALVRASRAAAAATRLTGTRQEFPLAEQAERDLRRAEDVIAAIDLPAVAAPLKRVAEAVRGEAAGPDAGALALEFDDIQTDGTIGTNLATLEEAVEAAATS